MRIRKPNFYIDSFRNTPRILANDIAICLSSPSVQEIIDEVSKKYYLPAFQNNRREENRLLANQVATVFFKTADIDLALSSVKPMEASDEILADWKNEIKNLRAFHLVKDAIVDMMRELHDQECADRVENTVSEAILNTTIESGRNHDASKPLDAIKGIQTICAYVPLSHEKSDHADVFTTFWSDRSNSTTIKPSKEFLEFLKLANISTSEWKDAVLEIHDVDLEGSLDDDAFTFEIERVHAWQKTHQDADDSKPSLVDVEELVYAIDNCPFGFTPLVSFSMPIEELVHRDWNEPIKLTGGILGLHDFINGSGDPLRFEGEIELSPTISNMMAAGARANDIASVHGFVDQSFKSLVEDITPERRLAM
jgi:hypothetical protein